MICKEIQDLSITDYADGELDASAQYDIEQHIKSCAACREFADSARRACEPLRASEKLQPPVSVWRGIEEAILAREETVSVSLRERLFGALQWGTHHPKPVFALSSAMGILIVAGVFLAQFAYRPDVSVRDYLRDQSDFMYSLNGGGARALDAAVNLGTGVEELLD